MSVTCADMAICSATYLEGAVHHTNDVVKLLVVQYGTVLLNMKTQFVSQTLASCFAFQCTQCSWQRLTREGRAKRKNIPLIKVKELQRGAALINNL